ncbi:hypothetical protein BE221DRAFT_193507 [Ostreococcus tauri]|uniref:Uncharacterized protein n=1 Tax=Ostreococcus tauri TaxID=70448 RepID=A0A1Y5I641_OSTTA|nr:hypothetical protein BE221DRAFT_193507 [Ostreococcus tauri]
MSARARVISAPTPARSRARPSSTPRAHRATRWTRDGRARCADDDASIATTSTTADARADADAAYATLKTDLRSTATTHAGALAVYCGLGYGVGAGLSAALGGCAALAYLKMLEDHVDGIDASRGGITEEDYVRNLVYEPVTDVWAMLGGALGKVRGVYARALWQKRLLVPTSLVIGTSAWNHLALPFDFSYGATFCGFLCYKTAVLAKTYDILRPLVFGGEDADDA